METSVKRLFCIVTCLVIAACSDPARITEDRGVDVRLPVSTASDAAMGNTTDSNIAPGFDAANQGVIDLGMGADRYIPPVRPDAGELTAEEALGACVDRMTNFITTTSAGFGCDQFTEQQQSDRSSDYNLVQEVAACIRLTCQGNPIEGHNGIPAKRTCSELDDLISVLERAEVQALEGGCNEPEFQLRVISLDDFVGGEPCDQLTCGIDGEGEPITIDNRN